jgi:hypothetical protein
LVSGRALTDLSWDSSFSAGPIDVHCQCAGGLLTSARVSALEHLFRGLIGPAVGFLVLFLFIKVLEWKNRGKALDYDHYDRTTK